MEGWIDGFIEGIKDGWMDSNPRHVARPAIISPLPQMPFLILLSFLPKLANLKSPFTKHSIQSRGRSINKDLEATGGKSQLENCKKVYVIGKHILKEGAVVGSAAGEFQSGVQLREDPHQSKPWDILLRAATSIEGLHAAS